MTGAIILDGDWSEYDKRKAANNEDAFLFNCKEEWEVSYLAAKVHERFDFLISERTIYNAISACCQKNHKPVNRAEFLDCIIAALIS